LWCFVYKAGGKFGIEDPAEIRSISLCRKAKVRAHKTLTYGFRRDVGPIVFLLYITALSDVFLQSCVWFDTACRTVPTDICTAWIRKKTCNYIFDYNSCVFDRSLWFLYPCKQKWIFYKLDVKCRLKQVSTNRQYFEKLEGMRSVEPIVYNFRRKLFSVAFLLAFLGCGDVIISTISMVNALRRHVVGIKTLALHEVCVTS